MPRLPQEARDGLMRAWLEILRERHPGVEWVPAEQERVQAEPGKQPSATSVAAGSAVAGRGLNSAADTGKGT